MSLVAVVVPQMYSLEGKNSDTAFSKLSSQSSYLLDAPGNLKNMQRRLKMFGINNIGDHTYSYWQNTIFLVERLNVQGLRSV